MKEVTKQEFFAAIGNMNVHPTPIGPFPYTSVFKTPSGVEVGRIVESFGTEKRIDRKYLLVDR